MRIEVVLRYAALGAAALVVGCASVSDPGPQIITVTGMVTDSVTGAAITRANVAVALGQCFLTCQYIGTPGTSTVDSTGTYSVSINGPVSRACGGAYYVQVDAGPGYFVATKSFDCGPVNVVFDFRMQPSTARPPPAFEP